MSYLCVSFTKSVIALRVEENHHPHQLTLVPKRNKQQGFCRIGTGPEFDLDGMDDVGEIRLGDVGKLFVVGLEDSFIQVIIQILIEPLGDDNV